CSAIHPLGYASPFFRTLPLERFGLEYIHPEILAAHPFDDGNAAVLRPSLEETANNLGTDRQAYLDLFTPLIQAWPDTGRHILTPLLKLPRQPRALAAFGTKALQSGKQIASVFRTSEARGLWAGLVAHSMIPLTALTSSAIGF